jgi:hypothetical protein
MSGGGPSQAKKRGVVRAGACHSRASDRGQPGPRFLPKGLALTAVGSQTPAFKQTKSADPLRRAQRGERLTKGHCVSDGAQRSEPAGAETG